MSPKEFFSTQGTISRRDFTIWGLVLFAIKYNIDRFIGNQFHKNWFINSYFMETDRLSVNELSVSDQRFYLLLLLFSIPFIWMGTALCLKRLRDTKLPLWLVAFFFLPLINIIFFFILCVLPGTNATRDGEQKPAFLHRLIPQSKTGSILFALGFSIVIALLVTFLSVDFFEEYGWGIFVAMPFFIGFSSVLLYSYHHQPISLGEAFSIGCSGVVFFGLVIIGVAMEGLICVVLVAPIGFLISMIGSFLAYSIQFQAPRSSLNSIAVCVLLFPFILWMEQQKESDAQVFSITTSITIDAPAQKVWNQLVAFNKIAPANELIFKAGIAYPENAVISGYGVGAVRHCNFTTGAFVEPITIWDEPNLLKFDVLNQPPPMTELSFYKNVNAPHLDGYFTSLKGQFKLVQLNDKQIVLEGTTWYKNRIWPSVYWKVWSDYILHKIHFRVLNHIKQNSEIVNKSISSDNL